MDEFGCKDSNGTVENLEGLNNVPTTSMMDMGDID
jgi:hypothetical protein